MGRVISDPNTTFPEEQKVNEQSKKALVHRIKSVSRRCINNTTETGTDLAKRFKPGSRKFVHATSSIWNPRLPSCSNTDRWVRLSISRVA